jgi:chromosome partitioning protein
MKSIVFTNLKGGCGKSMLLFQMSGMIADRNLKILLIDGDPQNNLSRAFTNSQHQYGLYEVLTNEISVQDAIIQPYKNTEYDSLKNIYLLPTNYDLFLYEKDSSNPRQIFELKNKLNVLSDLDFDYVLFDTNPSLSFILTSIYTYVDYYIGVFDISHDALNGFRFLDDIIIKDIKKNVNSKISCKGIVLNNYNRRTSYDVQCIVQ